MTTIRLAGMMAFALGALFSDTTWSRVLEPGQSIAVNEPLLSEDNRYYGTLQPDGNFVVYQNYGTRRAVWSTRTVGKGAVRAMLQADGVFALLNAGNVPVWRTDSRGPYRKFAITEHGQAMVLTVTDWWTSKTGDARFKQQNALIFPFGFHFEKGRQYEQGMYGFSLQHDGNMVLKRHGAPIWASHTCGATYAYVGPGLIIGDANGERFRMKGHYKEAAPGTVLYTKLGSVAVFPDGNLVAYRATQVWSSPRDWYETN